MESGDKNLTIVPMAKPQYGFWGYHRFGFIYKIICSYQLYFLNNIIGFYRFSIHKILLRFTPIYLFIINSYSKYNKYCKSAWLRLGICTCLAPVPEKYHNNNSNNNATKSILQTRHKSHVCEQQQMSCNAMLQHRDQADDSMIS